MLNIEEIKENRRNKNSNKRSKDGKKFNELANNLDIRLIRGTKNSLLNIAEYITNGKNIKIKPADSSLKNKRKANYLELPFGIMSFSSFVNTETLNIISWYRND